MKKGFAVHSLLILGLLLAGLLVTAYFIHSRVGVPPRAASLSAESIEDTAAATPADLGLKIIPKLNPEPGKVDLSVEWDPAKVKSDPNLKLLSYRLAVRQWDESGPKRKLVSPQPIGISDINISSKSFVGLPFKSNQEYFVALRSVYAKADNQITIKVQVVRLGYFEDHFDDKDTLLHNWAVYDEPREYKEVDIIKQHGNGVLSAKITAGQNKQDIAGIYMGSDSGKPFAVSFKLVTLQLPSDEKEAVIGLMMGDYETNSKSYSVTVTNLLGGQKIRQCIGPGAVICSAPISYVPGGVFVVTSSGSKVVSTYLGHTLDRNPLGTPFKAGNGVFLAVESYRPSFPAVGATFDDFRLVWVK